MFLLFPALGAGQLPAVNELAAEKLCHRTRIAQRWDLLHTRPITATQHQIHYGWPDAVKSEYLR